MKENEYKKNSSRYASRMLLARYFTRLSDIGIMEARRGTRLQHAMWMCHQAATFEDENKTSRWLGWIQCCLASEGIYDLAEIIDHTREEMERI